MLICVKCSKEITELPCYMFAYGGLAHIECKDKPDAEWTKIGYEIKDTEKSRSDIVDWAEDLCLKFHKLYNNKIISEYDIVHFCKVLNKGENW